MSVRAVYCAHWVRLAVATLVAALALAVVSLVEFGVVTVLTLVAVFGLRDITTGVVLALAPLVLFSVGYAFELASGRLSGGRVESKTEVDRRRLVALVTAGSLALLGAVQLLALTGMSPFWLAPAVGLSVVAVHQYRIWGRFRSSDAEGAVIPSAVDPADRPALRDDLQTRGPPCPARGRSTTDRQTRPD